MSTRSFLYPVNKYNQSTWFIYAKWFRSYMNVFIYLLTYLLDFTVFTSQILLYLLPIYHFYLNVCCTLHYLGFFKFVIMACFVSVWFKCCIMQWAEICTQAVVQEVLVRVQQELAFISKGQSKAFVLGFRSCWKITETWSYMFVVCLW